MLKKNCELLKITVNRREYVESAAKFRMINSQKIFN